ncbi:hypothetical protein B0H65DRAFT_480161 [Neurospora tetraspora]|uniref:Uncharacterized protein n=1 Tax=Neurospora tetraspora TaxID=94610 RepID=A0AAE0J1K2_9PEZI|nr:hypothetical protein B0H65DRAFT_480161 [Neurospora tetraspora]
MLVIDDFVFFLHSFFIFFCWHNTCLLSVGVRLACLVYDLMYTRCGWVGIGILTDEHKEGNKRNETNVSTI